MENSYVSDHHEDCTEEESGWTAYFQDFSDNNNHEEKGHFDEEMSFSSCTSSSMVSDAASYAAWKISDHHKDYTSLKRLNFKKTRAKVISEDHSLEDTASSPVNSPKVCDTTKAKEQRGNLVDSSIMGLKGSSECYSELHPEERRLNNGKKECIDLKKRGLCLVPMSMLVNYIG